MGFSNFRYFPARQYLSTEIRLRLFLEKLFEVGARFIFRLENHVEGGFLSIRRPLNSELFIT